MENRQCSTVGKRYVAESCLGQPSLHLEIVQGLENCFKFYSCLCLVLNPKWGGPCCTTTMHLLPQDTKKLQWNRREQGMVLPRTHSA